MIKLWLVEMWYVLRVEWGWDGCFVEWEQSPRLRGYSGLLVLSLVVGIHCWVKRKDHVGQMTL